MRIKVPGSSANLGPGFDCFGLAWQCYNEIDFRPGVEGLLISGCPERFAGRDNLAFAGYKAVLEAAGLEEEPLEIEFLKTDIPVSRGLGSSAALITAGAVAANSLHSLGLSRAQLLSIATPVEGHPDNIAPSLFGGFTVSTMEGQQAITASFPLSDKLFFTGIIPDFELSTELSRSVLPQLVPRADAIYNVSRASLLLRAMEDGDCELLSVALSDRIHQPFRTKLISGYDRALALAKELGCAGMCISGAGSTLLCISDSPDFTGKLSQAMAEPFPAWRVLELLPDMQGAALL